MIVSHSLRTGYTGSVMKPMMIKKILMGFLFLGLIHAAWADSAASEEINWMTYQKGVAAAKTEGKKIFLHFYASWCGYCKTMEQKTFKDASVVRYLNENFTSIKVNTDQQQNIAIQYRVRGLPSTWFLQDDGQKIANRPGYIAPKQLIGYLQFVNTDSYKKMSIREFLNNQE